MTKEPTLAGIAAAGMPLPLTPPFILERIPIPLDILDALVERYLPGLAPGWVEFDREEITGGSVLYRMRQENLGDLGTIKLLKTGLQESAMEVRRPPLPSPRDLTQEERDKLAAISDPGERERLLSIMIRLIRDERNARARNRQKHQADVIKALFNRLARDWTWQKYCSDLAQQTSTPAEASTGGDITLRLGKPGRRPDPLYDKAFERIRGGESIEDAFRRFCEEANIKKPDKGVRDAFKAAIKRRQNKS
ncbi:MAG: hypothetical protein DRI79_13980 [Chloroflexi bacterium]|nr:MAG: hypothetical protein DRI79_13980 [Chloroflexota bacterium]